MAGLRIGIAGAGLLGRLLAWQLARQLAPPRGAAQTVSEVSIFDPAPDSSARGAAGWTAAGMLSPLAELACGDTALAELGLRSLDLWPGLLAGLPASVHFRRAGSLLLAHRPDLGAAQRLVSVITAKAPAGLVPEALDATSLRSLEPELHGPAHAWLLQGEGQIHTVQAMQALAEGARRAGAHWRWGHAVQAVEPGRIDDEHFDWVFDVRGLGGRTAAPMGDLRGVRGEIAWLHAPGLALQRPLRLLHPRSPVYLVPRPDDIVVVGASEIESEDRSPISVRTLLNLLSAAHSVLPALAEARLVHTDTQLRPALPDNLPRLTQEPGLARINGLFRHGWLIAPAMVDDALRPLGLAGGAGSAAAAAASPQALEVAHEHV